MNTHTRRDDAVAMDDHVFYWLTLAVNHRNTTLARSLAPLGCTIAQWRVMNMLRQLPGASVGDLSEKTAVDRTTLTRTLDGLEKSGLILRDVRPENRRIASLNLSESGHAFFETILPLVDGLNLAATAGLPFSEVNSLIGTLRKIIVNLGGSVDIDLKAILPNVAEKAISTVID